MNDQRQTWNLDGSVDLQLDRDQWIEGLKADPEGLLSKYVGMAEQVDGLVAIILELGLRGTENLGAIGVAGIRLEEQASKIVELETALEKARRDLTKARGEIRVARKAQPAKLRKVGPIANAITAAAFGELIGSEPLEVVFSDGKNEIRGIDPLIVEGAAAWQKHLEGQWLLRQRTVLEGPAPKSKPHRVVGAGIFVDGEQIAWAQLFEPIVVPPAERVELVDSIII